MRNRDHMTENKNELYDMPMFVTLTVKNINESAKWYRNVLGFSEVFSMPDEDGNTLLCHLRWSKFADIMLAPEEEGNPPKGRKGSGVMITLAMTDGDVEEIAERAEKHGVPFAGPIMKPWNAKEVTVVDPDGYLLTFSKAADSGETFNDMIRNIQNSAQ